MFRAKQMILSVLALSSSLIAAAAEKDKSMYSANNPYYEKLTGYMQKTEKDEKEKPLLIMHWRAIERTPLADGLRIAKETGCNAIWLSANASPEAIKKVKDAGFVTFGSHGAWITVNPEWLKTHPEHRATRYEFKKQKAPETGPLVFNCENCINMEKAKEFYHVIDGRGKKLSPEKWATDEKAMTLTVPDPEPGKEYSVYYLRTAGHPDVNPLYPEFREGGMQKQLEEWYSNYQGILDYAMIDTLGLPKEHPYMYEYIYDTSPLSQQKFKEETGITFDPVWNMKNYLRLRNGQKAITPAPEYLKWVNWEVKHSKEFVSKLKPTLSKYNIKVFAYTYGDAWIGAEPYEVGNSLDAVDGFGPSPSIAGLKEYFPDLKRICQIWFYKGVPVDAWSKRKHLMVNIPLNGFLWGGLPDKDMWQKKESAQFIKNANDEIKMISSISGNKTAFKHDLTAYVLNIWGKMRSWKGPETEYLYNLPIKIKYISFDDIAKNGIPEDANLLISWGDADTEWNGGYMWNNPDIIAKIENFVAAGGGFIGVGAPGFFKNKKGSCQLEKVLGIDYTASSNMPEGCIAKKPSQKRKNWIGATAPDSLSFPGQIISERQGDFSDESESQTINSISVQKKSKNLEIIYQGEKSQQPVITANTSGKGRAVFMGKYCPSSEFMDLLKRAVFWTMKKEDSLEKLNAAHPAYIFAYPESKKIILCNSGENAIQAEFQIDFKEIFKDDSYSYLHEIVEDTNVRPVDTANGGKFSYTMPPYSIRFFELKK